MKKSIGLIILIVLTIVIMLAVLLIEFTVLLNPDAVVSRVDIIDGTLWIHYSDGTIMNSGIVIGANSQGQPPQSNRPSQSAPEADPETQAPEPETEPVLPPETEPETEPAVEPETETRIREYTVSFVLKGYSGQIPSQTVREGNRAQKPTVNVDPKVGTFDGVWYTSSSYSAASRYNFSDTVTKNITLYGYVEPNPAAPVWIIDADGLAAGQPVNAATVEVNEAGYASFTATDGDPYFGVANNLGVMPDYMVLRYRTNTTQTGEFFIGNGAGPEGGKSFVFNYNANSEWNLLVFHLPTVAPYMTDGTIGHIRFDFYTGGPEEGAFLDVEYIAFFNTAEYAENYDYELHKAPMWNEVDTVVTHVSFDELDEYAGETMIQGVFSPGQSASWDGIVHLQDFSVDTLRYWGWIALKGEVGQFGYQINGGKPVYNDAWTHATEDPVIDAAMIFGADTGSRMQIMISLAGLDGENTIRTLYKSDKGVEVCLSEFTVILPVKPKDITDTFASNVQSNAEGTDLRYSDLADFFTVNYGAGDPYRVVGGMYQFGGINEIFADVNGKYSFKMNQISASGCSWMFVRGYQVVNSDELIEKKDYSIGIYMINNYYETDRTNWMGNVGIGTGGAGIYAHIQDGTLYVVVKYYDETNITRVGNKSYSIPCDGTELTMADDGENVYILVNGKTMAVIELEGSTVYADINDVSPKNGFVTKATVKLADGTTDTILNTLVAETCECQIGLAVRAGEIHFDSIKLEAFSAVEIPEFESPDDPESGNTPTTNEINVTTTDTYAWYDEYSFIADATGTYTFTLPAGLGMWSVDAYNAWADPELDYNMYVDGGDVKISLEAGTEFKFLVGACTKADWIITYTFEEGEISGGNDPVTGNLVLDMSAFKGQSGYLASFPAAGYSDPCFEFSYGTTLDLGVIDLSRYSAVKITYGCDASDATEANFASASSLAIGLKSENSSYGQENDDNFSGDIAHTDMVFPSAYWAAGAQDAVVDLTNVDYNGNVWVAVHNPIGTIIVVSAIEFIV